MITVSRPLIVALVAVAVTSQLVQGHLLRCGQMDMSAAAGMMRESMHSSVHERGDARIATASSSDRGAQDQVPVSSGCILSGLCLNAPAVPSVSLPPFDAATSSPVIAYGMMSPAARELRPEAPPPRL